jgi:hypothetical protein
MNKIILNVANKGFLTSICYQLNKFFNIKPHIVRLVILSSEIPLSVLYLKITGGPVVIIGSSKI